MSKNLIAKLLRSHVRIGDRKHLRWNMTQIEQTFVSQINWCQHQHGFWDHAQGNRIPQFPHVSPFIQGRNRGENGGFRHWEIWRNRLFDRFGRHCRVAGDDGEGKGRPMEKPNRV